MLISWTVDSETAEPAELAMKRSSTFPFLRVFVCYSLDTKSNNTIQVILFQSHFFRNYFTLKRPSHEKTNVGQLALANSNWWESTTQQRVDKLLATNRTCLFSRNLVSAILLTQEPHKVLLLKRNSIFLMPCFLQTLIAASPRIPISQILYAMSVE